MTTHCAIPTSMSAPAYPQAANVVDLEADFVRMVDKAMAAVLAGEAKPDAVFGHFVGMLATARSASFHEGRLLEWGLIRIAACNPDLLVLPQNRPMPIVPAAIEILERNEMTALEGIRLNAEVHARASYTPDLVIVHRRHQSALIVDAKRSLASYADHRLDALRQRMLAAGLIASSWIYAEYKGLMVRDVGIAIIDGSDEVSDHAKGIFGVSEIDGLLEVAGAGDAMGHLRSLFAARVRDELLRQSRTALVLATPSSRSLHGEPVGAPQEPDDADPDLDDPAPTTVTGADMGLSRRTPRIDARVRVGFARSRASP